MLQINNLTITHNKDLRTIIDNFSITLNDGDKAAIIGEEGNGKSTLLKLIYDENLITSYADYKGNIIKKGLNIGYLAQEISEEDKKKTVYEFCSNKPEFFDFTAKELNAAANDIGISNDLFYSDQTVGSLSGGEKVKLQLALIMISSPDVLLLDEPSNDIDIETLKWLEKFINKTNIPIMYISHDEVLLENTANMIVHIEQLKRKTVSKVTVSKSGYREYVDKRLRSLSHQEQVAKKERSEYEKQQEKFRQIQQKVEAQQNNISRSDPHGGRLLKKKMHSVKSQERRFEKEYENFTEIPHTEESIFIKFSEDAVMPNGKDVLKYEKDNLVIGDRILSQDIKLNVIGPQKVCIIGRNGIGKTTLIKDISSILLNRKDIKAFYMPQNYEDLLDYNMTPVEFLDEPTRNFSPLSNPVIREMLKNYSGAIISISHDRKYIREVCSDIYELTEDGLKKVYEI